jgi:hypothetical protein
MDLNTPAFETIFVDGVHRLNPVSQLLQGELTMTLRPSVGDIKFNLILNMLNKIIDAQTTHMITHTRTEQEDTMDEGK